MTDEILFYNETLDMYVWSKHCEDVARGFSKSLNDILKHFVDKYDVHQVSEETSTMEHYKSNWDLYFWSNEGWNGKDYMDYTYVNYQKDEFTQVIFGYVIKQSNGKYKAFHGLDENDAKYFDTVDDGIKYVKSFKTEME